LPELETEAMPRVLVLIGLALCIALAVASTVSAGDTTREPSVFASGELGPFEIISSVLIESDAVDQRGGWLNNSVSCLQKRLLRVRATLFFQPTSGPTKEIVRNKKARVRNCAEGGPNLGVTLRATPNNLACPDGTWKPGTYSFVTRTTHRKTKLRAVASVTWEKTEAC